MSIEDDIAFLERVPTLQVLGRTALRILAIGAESRYVHDGEELFSVGDHADCGYVVQEGSFTLDGADRAGVHRRPRHLARRACAGAQRQSGPRPRRRASLRR